MLLIDCPIFISIGLIPMLATLGKQAILWKELTKENRAMLWTILVILLVLWLLGFIGHVGGNLVHILIVLAAIILIINLVSGRRRL